MLETGHSDSMVWILPLTKIIATQTTVKFTERYCRCLVSNRQVWANSSYSDDLILGFTFSYHATQKSVIRLSEWADILWWFIPIWRWSLNRDGRKTLVIFSWCTEQTRQLWIFTGNVAGYNDTVTEFSKHSTLNKKQEILFMM